MFRYPLSILPAGMAWKRLARIVLPVLLALLVIACLFIPARLAGSQMPQAQNGVLNLADWNRKQAFAVIGQWELYWDCLLSDAQIKSSGQAPILVNAPDKWSHYEIGGVSLPEKGKATYHVHVTGAQAGEVYVVRIKDMRNVYRLYADGVLVAQNGSFGDDLSAPASAYRPQLAAFTPAAGSFDLVMQVGNHFYGNGGMLEPVMFGTYAQVAAFDRQLSNVVTYAMTVQTVSCLFFLIFFLAQRREKEALVLSVLAADILLRLSIIGDALFTMFPNISAAWLGRLYLLCTPWAEFLLPSLVLQPLVENAFVHGLREKDNGGTVIVYVTRVKNGRVRVGVRDDGIGFSEKASPTRRGVGIENINRRLAGLYRTSLIFSVPQGGGCEVYFEIPSKEVANHESMDH